MGVIDEVLREKGEREKKKKRGRRRALERSRVWRKSYLLPH